MPIEKLCLLCGKSFKTYPSFKAKYCSTICYHSTKPRVEKVCLFCEKSFIVVNNRKGAAKYCSVLCMRQSEEKLRITKTCPTCQKIFIVRPSYKNVSFCNRKCRRHTDESKTKMSASASAGYDLFPERREQSRQMVLKHLAGWGKGETKETSPKIANRAKILSKKYKGKAMPQLNNWREYCKTPLGRIASSERMKRFNADNPDKHINARLAKLGHETYIEKKLRLALESANISFLTQYKIDRYWADFVIIEHRLVIEADGEQWHQDKEKDAKRDEIIQSHGWRVLRFTGKQINSNTENCLSEIQRAMQSK